jgi:hypothetical protein
VNQLDEEKEDGGRVWISLWVRVKGTYSAYSGFLKTTHPIKREETNKKYMCKPSSILFEDKVL